ncbi:Bacterial alpha-L-rhamnosidase concanavalin-like domain [Pelomyxa schiedti]|nr:Bacterial alpha-L-rhamnosidase concanavalin-like domain [Pelomyxa schiedti]
MKGVLGVVVVGFVVGLASALIPSPVGLRVQGLTQDNALGIGVKNPTFSWKLPLPSKKDYANTPASCQVIVSLSDGTTVWNSGEVALPSHKQSLEYKGPDLLSAHTYTWTVRWWNTDGEVSPWSQRFRFGTGLLNDVDWSAQWITGYNMFRKDFTLSAGYGEVKVFLCGLGYYELWVNGARVGDSVLDPGWTVYNKRSLYTTYDITDLVMTGTNAIGVLLGRGWWGQDPNFNQDPVLILQVAVDGVTSVITDTTWKGAASPITSDSIYNGETYDARLEKPGWANPNFDDSTWSTAKSSSGPGGSLLAQAIPPIKRMAWLSAGSISTPKSGVYVYDFEQNFSGWCVLNVTGASGTTVTLRHAEIINSDGTIYVDNLRSAAATDTYILKGSGDWEIYEPRFTYHGFRFVELTGYNNPTLETLQCTHVYSSVEAVGEVVFSDSVLNQIQHNIHWGQESNLMSIPTDCCQRDERLGWMADAELSSEEAIHNYDMQSFYTNFAADILNEQVSSGAVPDTVPYIWGSIPADPAWGSEFPHSIYWLWKYYGDTDIVATNYAAVKNYVDFLTTQASNGLGNFYGYYGDWCPPPPSPECSISYTSSYYYIMNIGLLCEMADMLGKTDDYQTYTQLKSTQIEAFNSAFKRDLTYNIGVQTTQALALDLGAVPSTEIKNVTYNLLDDIWDQDTHVTTGIIGVKVLMEQLSKSGRTDTALALAQQTTYPSWGYMFQQTAETPATTLWELWDSPREGSGMNSRNHIMFGSVGAWFYKYLAGITQDADSAGFEHIIINPPQSRVIAHSTLANVSAHTAFAGKDISVSWSHQGGTQCREAPENRAVSMWCGDGGVISSITFASFGTPTGECGHYSINSKCHSANSSTVMSSCIGKSYCEIEASNTEFGGDPCYDTVKKLIVQFTCSNSETYKLTTSIPTGSDAVVHIAKLDFSDLVVYDGDVPIWKNGQLIPGAPGILSATSTPLDIALSVSSGEYEFSTYGTSGTVICSVTAEDSTAVMQCPTGYIISTISFASFGTPTYTAGTCSSYQLSTSCHAGSSVAAVEDFCLGNNMCEISVQDDLFGDPCYGTLKWLAVEAICTTNS